MPKGHNRKSTWMRLGELDWEEQRDLQSVSLPASMTGMVPREHLLDLGAGIKQLMGEREIRKERYVGSTGDVGRGKGGCSTCSVADWGEDRKN